MKRIWILLFVLAASVIVATIMSVRKENFVKMKSNISCFAGKSHWPQDFSRGNYPNTKDTLVSDDVECIIKTENNTVTVYKKPNYAGDVKVIGKDVTAKLKYTPGSVKIIGG